MVSAGGGRDADRGIHRAVADQPRLSLAEGRREREGLPEGAAYGRRALQPSDQEVVARATERSRVEVHVDGRRVQHADPHGRVDLHDALPQLSVAPVERRPLVDRDIDDAVVARIELEGEVTQPGRRRGGEDVPEAEVVSRADGAARGPGVLVQSVAGDALHDSPGLDVDLARIGRRQRVGGGADPGVPDHLAPLRDLVFGVRHLCEPIDAVAARGVIDADEVAVAALEDDVRRHLEPALKGRALCAVEARAAGPDLIVVRTRGALPETSVDVPGDEVVAVGVGGDLRVLTNRGQHHVVGDVDEVAPHVVGPGEHRRVQRGPAPQGAARGRVGLHVDVVAVVGEGLARRRRAGRRGDPHPVAAPAHVHGSDAAVLVDGDGGASRVTHHQGVVLARRGLREHRPAGLEARSPQGDRSIHVVVNQLRVVAGLSRVLVDVEVQVVAGGARREDREVLDDDVLRRLEPVSPTAGRGRVLARAVRHRVAVSGLGRRRNQKRRPHDGEDGENYGHERSAHPALQLRETGRTTRTRDPRSTALKDTVYPSGVAGRPGTSHHRTLIGR